MKKKNKMIKKKGGKMTIDRLAIMMNNSFESLEKKMATKEDIKDMATKTDVERLEKRIDDFAETKASKIQYKELENRVQKVEAKI